MMIWGRENSKNGTDKKWNDYHAWPLSSLYEGRKGANKGK